MGASITTEEVIRLLKSMKKEIAELRELVTPLSPKKDEILYFKEAQVFLKFSRSKLRQLIRDNEIPFSKKESRIRFSKNALVQWMNQ